MHNPFWALLSGGFLTQKDIFPDLLEDATGLPALCTASCAGGTCQQCVRICPTGAITVTDDSAGGVVTLDRGRCIGCQECINACPSGTIIEDRSTRTAVRTRVELILSNRQKDAPARPSKSRFYRSLHVREVSTGSNATDLEVLASTNSVFDVNRFGINYVASPRFADVLLVTGPVGKAMHEPLRHCYDAMAEPRLVIAAGTDAISGGLHAGGYAQANGIADLLPVACYIPGDPPHPWSLIYGLLLTMGRV